MLYFIIASNIVVKFNSVGAPDEGRPLLMACRSPDSSLAPLLRTPCVMGKRGYFTSLNLFEGWSNKQTATGNRVYPLDDLYYAI